MPFLRPTLVQLRRRIQSDFRHAFQNDAVLYPGTVEHAFCEALIGLSHAAHGRLDQIYRDAFPHLASEAGVSKWAAFFNMFKNRATYASIGETVGVSPGIRFDGIAATIVPLGTIFVRDDGFEYRTTAEGTVDTWIPAVAKVPGTAGNADQGTLMELQSSITGVDSQCFASLGPISGGADAELPEALRARLLAVLAEPPGGGKKGDYVRWAKMVTGVTRAWEFGCKPKVGDVTVVFVRDLDADPFPDAGERAAVLAQILEFAPISLPIPTVQEPNDHPLTLEIDLTIEDGAVLATVRAAIIASIQAMIAQRASPPAAAGELFYRSWISEAISTTTGELDHKLVTPAADIVLGQWDLVTLDPVNVTWTP